MKSSYTLLSLALLALLPFGNLKSQTTAPSAQYSPTADPLENKTILVFGDSYVANHRDSIEHTWHYKVAKRHSMRYINAGRNGSSIAFDRTRDGFGPSMLTRLMQINEPADYVVVIAGHNDAGLVKNNTDSLKIFRYAMYQLCDALLDKYPAARICFVTPWNVDRAGFRPVIDTIVDVCGEYSIPVLRADTESGIHVRNEAFRQRFFQNADTAHLNNDGHNLIVNWAERFLMGL